MNLKDLTNLQFIKSLFTFSSRVSQKYTDEDIRKNIGLYLSKAGYYGTYDPSTKETSPLEVNQTDFTSTITVNILIEGYINLSKAPNVTGGGSIAYNGYGVLEVNGSKVYDGRSSAATFATLAGSPTDNPALALLVDPTSPGSDAVKYYEQILNGVKTWQPLVDVNGTSLANKNKLQANGADWVNDFYVGGISGAITGTKGGEVFWGIQVIPANTYAYFALGDNIWYRIFRS